MPTGVPYHGHIPPYDNIRVDSFTTPRPADDYTPADLFLLTHAHSDHLGGLAAKAWGCPVYCSADTKVVNLVYDENSGLKRRAARAWFSVLDGVGRRVKGSVASGRTLI